MELVIKDFPNKWGTRAAVLCFRPKHLLIHVQNRLFCYYIFATNIYQLLHRPLQVNCPKRVLTVWQFFDNWQFAIACTTYMNALPIWMEYSGTPLNGHPWIKANCDITARHPDPKWNSLCTKQPLNKGYPYITAKMLFKMLFPKGGHYIYIYNYRYRFHCT